MMFRIVLAQTTRAERLIIVLAQNETAPRVPSFYLIGTTVVFS